MVHPDWRDPEIFLRALFARAVEVADPMRFIPDHLPRRPAGRVLVVGAGKASARMAEAVEAAWGRAEGLVITRYGYARPCRGIEIVEAAHPVPDEAGYEATGRMLGMLRRLGAGDQVIALISGGASSLLVRPVEGVSLADMQSVNAALLASGAPIGEMNVVRKHLSQVKGGQLAAAAYPASVLALMISDVPGDDPGQIGSGPTVGEASTPAEARDIVARRGIKLPASAERALRRGSCVVGPGDARLALVQNRVVAAPAQSLTAAAEVARAAGCRVDMLGDALEGEARDVAGLQARRAQEIRERLRPGDAPVVMLSGGELTVTRRGEGSGGPNAEFALALALELHGAPGVHAIACDTDGVDGSQEVAGAMIGPDTVIRGGTAGRDARHDLGENDSHGFFAAIGGQVVTGPTLTNVNDFRAILVMPPEG